MVVASNLKLQYTYAHARAQNEYIGGIFQILTHTCMHTYTATHYIQAGRLSLIMSPI